MSTVLITSDSPFSPQYLTHSISTHYSYHFSSVNSFRLSLEYTLGSKTVLNCISDGLPATATLWNKDGILISLNTTSNEEIYSSLQTLMVASDASYNNILTIHSSSLQGIYTCDIYSDWMSTDLSDSGRECE